MRDAFARSNGGVQNDPQAQVLQDVAAGDQVIEYPVDDWNPGTLVRVTHE